MRLEKAAWITWIDQHSSHEQQGSVDVIYTFQHDEARELPKQCLCDKTGLLYIKPLWKIQNTQHAGDGAVQTVV